MAKAANVERRRQEDVGSSRLVAGVGLPITIAMIAAIPDMVAALWPIAAAYSDDPGTSDLYNDQPVSITLGDVRRVWAALRKAGVR
jgi:hypothetical protein